MSALFHSYLCGRKAAEWLINMKNIFVDVKSEISIGDLHYMEDFVMDYTAPSVFEQVLEGVPDAEIENTYRSYIVQEFLRESILRGRSNEE